MWKKTVMAMTLFAMVFLWCGFAFGAGWRDKDPAVGTPQIGRPAPDFTLPGTDGIPVSLSGLRGKVVVLVFWASWCPACREELPALAGLHRRMAGQGVMVLGINGGESAARVKDFMNKTDLDLPVILDASGDVHGLYQVRQYPTTFIIDRRGQIAERHIGLRDWNAPEVAETLRALAGNGAEVRP